MGGWLSRVTEETKHPCRSRVVFTRSGPRQFAPPRPAHGRWPSLRARRRLQRHARRQQSRHRPHRAAMRRHRRPDDGRSSFPSSLLAPRAASPSPLRLAEVRRHLGRTLEANALSATLVENFLGGLGCELTATCTPSTAQLPPAARHRARDRPHRRSRARLRLQPLRRHLARVSRNRPRASARAAGTHAARNAACARLQ